MQITQYTAQKRIGFKLPPEAFRALRMMEERRSPLFQDVITLRLNLSRMEGVVGSHLGSSENNTVFVDFETDPNEAIPSLEAAAQAIRAHALAAVAVDRFLPGTHDYGYTAYPQFAVDGSLINEFGGIPSGRVVHADEEFAVIANARPGSVSIHFIRDGKPGWTEAQDFEGIGDIFWDALTDKTVKLDGPVVLPTSKVSLVTDWVMRNAYVPALEHDGTFDISTHALGEWVSHGKILYADRDIVITGDRLDYMTAHFEDDGRYGCAIFKGEKGRQLSEALQTPGLPLIDPTNAVRVLVDRAIDTRRNYLATRDASVGTSNPSL
ncbi:hypothetical protein G6L37_07445 [Agrobacterium rubi]|nr:hypothetical protein [Agrobacterium rubi]NTF25202.1 hypothetical protein [Agrobacterium rubi]